MFTLDYRVHPASSIKEAVEVLAREQIGVIVSNAEVDGVNVTNLLAEVARMDPAIAVVVLTATPQSDTIIKLINSGKIYRFAIRPLAPNLFRLAVHAAMREHHRRLADPRVVRQRMQSRDIALEQGAADEDIYSSFITSLSRFTEVS